MSRLDAIGDIQISIQKSLMAPRYSFCFSATAPTPAPFDTAVGIVAAYSTRKLLTAYAGSALRVRRSSDNAELDIGFNGSGDLDQTALTTFVGANSGYVTVWYDQSGGARNLANPTTTGQFRIVNAGVVDTVNGRASPLGTPATSYGYTSIPVILTGILDTFQVLATDLVTAGARGLSVSDGGADWGNASSFAPTSLTGTTANYQAYLSPTATADIAYTSGSLVAIYTKATPTGISQTIGSTTRTAAVASTLSITKIYLGTASYGSRTDCGNGYKSEFVLTNSVQTSQAVFSAEQRTYWGAL